jgi:predicted N-acyltransferase
LSFRIITNNTINDCPASEWNLFAGNNPFCKHEFLQALESSGATSSETGWIPRHLSIIDNNEKTVGFVPLFEKHHSYGEYIFDWAWADAYRRQGLTYYPKLVSSIPYSPVTGKRLLHDHHSSPAWVDTAINFIKDTMENEQLSSWHCLHLTESESNLLTGLKAHQRLTPHFIWHNRGYTDFDDFLGQLKSRKRKLIRKERNRVRQQDIHFKKLYGDDLQHQHIEQFYRFYQYTYLKRSGHSGYLDCEFFLNLSNTMKENLLMIGAFHNEQMIAASLFLQDENNLYGRYWGTEQELEFLHFETCYYQGIEYCIETGRKHFDPGTQGEHKVVRGFEPGVVYSNHLIGHPGFSEAIERYTGEEARHNLSYIESLSGISPYRSSQEECSAHQK